MNGAAARVLVVDDDKGVRESLLMALGYEAYDVTAVSNGGEALAQLAGDHEFDAVRSWSAERSPSQHAAPVAAPMLKTTNCRASKRRTAPTTATLRRRRSWPRSAR